MEYNEFELGRKKVTTTSSNKRQAHKKPEQIAVDEIKLFKVKRMGFLGNG
jgi:hypothetical protein